VNNFATLKENFEINPLSDREPVKIFENMNRSYDPASLFYSLSSLPCSEFFGVEQWFSEGGHCYWPFNKLYNPLISRQVVLLRLICLWTRHALKFRPRENILPTCAAICAKQK
jgi:hypothetical protein